MGVRVKNAPELFDGAECSLPGSKVAELSRRDSEVGGDAHDDVRERPRPLVDAREGEEGDGAVVKVQLSGADSLVSEAEVALDAGPDDDARFVRPLEEDLSLLAREGVVDVEGEVGAEDVHVRAAGSLPPVAFAGEPNQLLVEQDLARREGGDAAKLPVCGRGQASRSKQPRETLLWAHRAPQRGAKQHLQLLAVLKLRQVPFAFHLHN